MDIINGLQKPLKPSVVEFLRSQQCGFESGFPKVCCSGLPKRLRVFKDVSTTTQIIPTEEEKKLAINLSAVLMEGSRGVEMQEQEAKVFEVKKTTKKPVDEFEEPRKGKNIDIYLDLWDIEDLTAFDLVRKRRENCSFKDVEIR